MVRTRTTVVVVVACLACLLAFCGCATARSAVAASIIETSSSPSNISSVTSGVSSDNADVLLEYANDIPADTRRIFCWGDSLTAGNGASEAHILTTEAIYDASKKSYPDILEDLTGIRTLNYGYPGATSEDIALYYTLFNLVDSIPTQWPYSEIASSDNLPGKDDIVIFEIGSNGGWNSDFDTLIAQYRMMIEQTQCSSYLILGDTDDPGTSIGDVVQWPLMYGSDNVETMWEHVLQEEFGDHFVNTRLYIIQNGLSMVGFEETYEDYENAQLGCISEQLRSDWTHLNSYGYYVKARCVYERGVELGYW